MLNPIHIIQAMQPISGHQYSMNLAHKLLAFSMSNAVVFHLGMALLKSPCESVLLLYLYVMALIAIIQCFNTDDRDQKL